MKTVLVLSYVCCIRVVKELFCFDGNDEFDFIHLQEHIGNTQLNVMLPHVVYYRGPDMLRHKLSYLRDRYQIDLIHCHNEPNHLVGIAREFFPDTPIVFDCHDLESIRSGTEGENEAEAMKKADAYIFPSQSYLEGATRIHSLTKPRLVLYSMTPKSMYIPERAPTQRGFVYEGGILALDKVSQRNKDRLHYRDNRGLIKQITDTGIPFAIYSPGEKYYPQYEEVGASCYKPLQYAPMLQTMSEYDWGFFGTEFKHAQMDSAMPNKLFDCVAAGIPLMVYQAQECAEYVEKHGLGIKIESVEDIAKVYKEHKRLRRNVIEAREKLCMETQVSDLIGLYNELSQSFPLQ